MIVLLSPAKTLDYNIEYNNGHSQPRLLSESTLLVENLRGKSVDDIRALMKVSDNIAVLNHQRFQAFETPFNTDNAKPAALVFKGDVYQGLDANSLDEESLDFAQKHIRILSGLYGILRPLDLMQPYRLEMGTKLQNDKGKNLYEFWGNQITDLINEDLVENNNNIIINLASNEYFKSVKKKALQGQIYDIQFKENRNGIYKIIAFNAKKARGRMARYIAQNKITNAEALKAFDWDNYLFNEDLSNDTTFCFTR